MTVATFDVVLHRSLNALKKALTKTMGDPAIDLDPGAPHERASGRQKETVR